MPRRLCSPVWLIRFTYKRQILSDELRKILKLIARVVLQLWTKDAFFKGIFWFSFDESYFIVVDKKPLVKTKQKTFNKANKPSHEVQNSRGEIVL